MKNFRGIGIICLTLLVLIMSVSAVTHGAGKSSGKAELQEHWEGGMLPEESPVSTRSYWRYWLTYAPAMALKGGKLVPCGYRYSAGSASKNFMILGRTAPPPATWAEADFDDSAWLASRIPMNMVHQINALQFSLDQHMIRQSCFRTRFVVPDPSKVRKLIFTAVFHGGLIVRINGREVARKHIPSEGMLAKAGYAEPFPEGACGPVSEEMKKLGRKFKVGSSRGWTYMYFFNNLSKQKDPKARGLLRQVRELLDRRIEVEVPREALRKGINVLALELRLSPGRGRIPTGRAGWPHGLIRFVTLDAEPKGAVRSADKRPDGVQVWAEDIHRRVMTEDFLEPGVKARRTLRLVCARGGRHSAQVLVGTTGSLEAPSATLSDLSGPGGAVIPASAVSVRWGRPLDLAATRAHAIKLSKNGREYKQPLTLALLRYRKPVWDFREREERLRYPCPVLLTGGGQDLMLGKYGGGQKADLWNEHGKGLMLFDRLSEDAPGNVPAGTCQPLWITTEVPAGAKAGRYDGELTLFAAGMTKTSFPVRLQVFDWKLPAPKESTYYAGIDQSPWSLARSAKVKLWSEKHWKLVEESMKWCGRLGARAAVLPVVQNSEVDNGKDTMVKWVRTPAGKYAYDFSLADRYLDLWRKHCHEQSDVIVHVLGTLEFGFSRVTSNPGTVVAVDPDTGVESTLTPIDGEATPEGIRLWVDCCKAIREHLNAQGISDDHILFGIFHDKVGEINEALIKALHKEIPEVGWARASHFGGKKGVWLGDAGKSVVHKVKWDACLRGAGQYIKGNESPFRFEKKGDPTTYRVSSHMGWKNPQAPLSNSMWDNDVIGLGLLSPLWEMRVFPEMVITTAYRGFAQACLDGYERCPRGFGPCIRWLVYPTARRVDGSAQFEALCEGLQEAEARIFLEGKDALPEDVQNLLDRRTERGWQVSMVPIDCGQGAEWYAGWQERSWNLFAAAARVAGGKVPSAEEKKRFFGK